MKKIYLKVGPGYAMKHLQRAPAADAQGGGNDKKKKDGENKADDDDPDASAELKAINKISKQVDEFNTMLGEKASAEEIKQLKDDIKELKDGLETLTSKQVTELLEKINLQNASLHKQIIELQEEAAKTTEAGSKSPFKQKELISTKAVQDFVKATFGDVTAEGKAVGEKTNTGARIEIKAAETFGYPQFFTGAEGTDPSAFTGRFIDPTLYVRKRKRNLILDNFDIQTIGVPTLVYLTKVEVGDDAEVALDPGSADWILSGQTKPQRSFRVASAQVEAKKVAIYGNVEDKLLRDVSSLENWIREDFMLEMKEKINDGLLNNNPAINALAPLGLKTNAVQYSATPAFDQTLEDVTYIDAIFALAAFFIHNKEEAAQIFVSSDVYFRILSLKDNNARFQNNQLIYTNALGDLYIGGIKVTWADEEDVPSANVLVTGVDLGFKMKAYGPMVFERGLNGNDFKEDKTSFRAYQEFLSYIPENRENSVLYDTWANIFAAITKP